MAIVFSIGFTVTPSTPGPIVSLCGGVNDRDEVRGRVWDVSDIRGEYMDAQNLCGVWPRSDGMICSVERGCLTEGFVCGPRGDDVTVIVSVYDTDGDEFDISGATEIVFAVADQPGGTVRITKKLSLGNITISTNTFQFVVTITDDDTRSLVRVKNYYEAQVTTAAGLKKTVSAGLFRSDDTIIKDIV